MRTILLAWEFGGGFGHVVLLRRIAARLAAHGLRFVAAVKDLATAAALADDGIEVLQAPLWKSARSSATLGDTLGDVGFADPQALQQRLEAWGRIIDRYKPALVISDYAPGASLAARGRVPLALVGNGFTLPPAEMARFPLLHQMSPPVWREQQMLDSINAVLSGLRLKCLQRLPELFAGDANWVHTFPLLDPYAAWRKRPAQGPLMEELPRPRAADGAEILIYLSSWRGAQLPLLPALRVFAHRIRIFAPGLPEEERAAAAAVGMRFESKPFRLTEDLARARLVIHLGSEGMATACVLAGVPQFACAIDVEKELIGKALTQAGIGRYIAIYDPAMALSEDVVAAALADEAMAARAQDVGEAHRAQYQDADPLGEFETACLQLAS